MRATDPKGGRGGARGEPAVRPGFSMRVAALAAPSAANTMRWARTGAQVTWQEWLEDCLVGALWYVGILVVLAVLAHGVQVMAG